MSSSKLSIRLLYKAYFVVLPLKTNLSPVYDHDQFKFWQKHQDGNTAFYLPVLEWLYETR